MSARPLASLAKLAARTAHSYRDTASFGRRNEYIAAAELLKRGFDVYMTLVDDQGIDCAIRLDEHRYIDVQIKARSSSAKHPTFFPALRFEPRHNLWFIFYSEKAYHYWVIPSSDVATFGRRNKSGKNEGRISIRFPTRDIGTAAERFAKYRDDTGFDLMRELVLPAPKRRQKSN